MADSTEEQDETYSSEDNYKAALKSKAELANFWDARIQAAERKYQIWANRFKPDMLYQYYEGFQWLVETDENNRPYVINMVYTTIETKLPNLIFNEPKFNLTPRPIGTEFDLNSAIESSQTREDALNFICSRKEFGITDLHELAILDAFFGFGVMETGYSNDRYVNLGLSEGNKDPLGKMYCKHIPFDTFRVSALANWDLSKGKWYGYYDFIPYDRLDKFKSKLKFRDKDYAESEQVEYLDTSTGKIQTSQDTQNLVAPAGTCKIWFLWDLETMKNIIYAPDAAAVNDRVLEQKDFEHSPHGFLRFGKRRKGWYPYPPVWNWIHPQDEINDIHQTQRIHRKRFSRKYAVLENKVEQEELDKFLYGPDGTLFKVKGTNAAAAIQPIADPPLDQSAAQSMVVSYDDFNRIAGTSDEKNQVADRSTATQATLVNQAAQIRDSKDLLRVGDFLEDTARNILRGLRKVDKPFWIQVKINEGLLEAVNTKKVNWKRIPPQIFKKSDDDVNLNITSLSPTQQNNDKKSFMEFLALITQYEMLAFSPTLLREAAYRCGYKNSGVLDQLQQWAQLAAIGRSMQLKEQVSAATQQQIGQGGQQPSQPGQLPQQQVDASTPPDGQSIMNTIFNRQGIQQ